VKFAIPTLALLFVSASALVRPSIAQTNPNLEQGFTAYGSYDSAVYSSVSLTNGNLVLSIPLLTTHSVVRNPANFTWS